MFKVTGTVIYKEPQGWVVVDVPNSIALYYRKVIEWMTWDKLQQPLYGAHITVVNGRYTYTVDHKAWKKYDGKKVKLFYDGRILNNDKGYFWINMEDPSGLLFKIREELDLPKNPPYPFHMTIGHSYAKFERYKERTGEENC